MLLSSLQPAGVGGADGRCVGMWDEMLPYLSLQLADDGPMVFLLPLLFYK